MSEPCPTCGGTVERPKLRTDGLSGFCADDFHNRKPSERCGAKPGFTGHHYCFGCEDCKPSDSPTEAPA